MPCSVPFSVSFSVSLAVSRLGVQPFAHRGFGVSLTVSLAVSFSVSLAVSLSASAAPEGFRAQSRPMDGDASSACAGQISGAMFAALVRRVRRVRRRVCPCSVVRRLAVSFWRSTVCGGLRRRVSVRVQRFAAVRRRSDVQRFGGLRRRVSVRVQRFGGLRRRDVQRFGGSVSVRVRFGG